ncbi:hypothetical protein N7466_001988 [Penicillium verhagenii]|uniref:uncharacterized protein n=1 Tax=Penicillium verhagenii TaxID=1562060 RepID=UPI0025459740|nr:uncharacterized protein N7466_001988 [Penicillium verhagenii]KAJ5938854.1 hypothetical protein N7466_001988 [Penicillium verhagenii]
MIASLLTGILCVFSSLDFTTALAPGNVALRTRNAPGTTDKDTINAVGHALNMATLKSRGNKVYSMNKTSLAKSWTGANLFVSGESGSTDETSSSDVTAAIEIICSTCYVDGSVSGALTLTGGFNLNDTITEVTSDVKNVTEQVIDQLKDYVESTLEDIVTNDADDISWPTIDVDLNMEDTLSGLPDAQIQFKFDNLELYLELDIKLSTETTYALNLFTSDTPVGFEVPGVDAGAIFSVSLILIADAEIDIGTGIHIKLDDGLAFDMEMFSSNVSSFTMPGGVYEFLPVTIAGNGSIQAILSLEASLGVNVYSTKEDLLDTSFSAGVGADIFAYVADFQLEVDGSTTADDGDCELAAIAEYTMAVGAAAGATVAIDAIAWGPSPNTTIPVWYTTLASVCATSKTSTATTSAVITARAELDARDDSTTTTISTTETYTIINCQSQGLVNCPVTLQSTTSTERVITSTVTVQSGSSATFPATTISSVTSTVEFGTNVRSLRATAGSPTSYNPSTATGSTGGSILDGTTDGTSNKLIIGLSVGLGLPFLAALIVGVGLYIAKRKKYALVAPQAEATTEYSPSMSYDSPPMPGTPGIGKDATRVYTTES